MKTIHWIALALAIAFGIAVCDGLRIRDKYSISIGNYQAALDTSKKDGAALTLQIAEMTAIVGQKDKEIAEKNEAIGHMTNTIGQIKKSEAIAKAESDKLKTEVQPVIDANPKLKMFVGLLESRLAEIDKIILSLEYRDAEKDKVIAAWAAKYDAQVTISESWKQKYENELHLRTLAEKGWKASENKLRWTRVLSNVKTGLICGALGYIGYSILKGK